MRTLALSLLLTAVAVAQPPMPLPPKPAPPSNTEFFLNALQAAEKPPAKGSVEEAILNAQRNHPDIKLAEAKRQMADAELEQAKLQVAQRVAAAFSKVEQAKANLAPAEEYFDAMKRGGTKIEAMQANAAYQKWKAELAAAELELKAATGAATRGVSAATDPNQAAIESGLKWLARKQAAGVAAVKPAPVGTTADKLKLVLDRMVTLDLKAVPLDRAMEALKAVAAEPTLTIKLPMLGKDYLKDPPTATIKVEKIPLTAAVQLILDEINDPVKMAGVPENLRGIYEVYVREYGLLIARAQDAPKDAPTLAEFARQVRAEKAEKK